MLLKFLKQFRNEILKELRKTRKKFNLALYVSYTAKKYSHAVNVPFTVN